MLITSKKYRKDYTGERIVTERNHESGVWNDVYETIPNAVANNQISNRAAVIGNGVSRLQFNLSLLKHPSGLLGAKTLQTYGCNALYRDFTPDFLIATGNEITQEISNTNFVKDHIVYTSAIHMLEYPNKFYLIPFDPYADAGTTAMYIAAFDGHKRIYLLGFDGQDSVDSNNNIYAGTTGYDAKTAKVLDEKWIHNRKMIFDTYNDVDFVRVTPRGHDPIPELWKYATNFRQISFRQFSLEADL